MNKFQAAMQTISNNKKQILIRTAVVAGSVVGVTLAAGFFKTAPVEAAEAVVKAAKKAAE